MSKYTPGPWKAHPTGLARSGLPEYQIHWSDIGECVAEVVHGDADARLIAAAPELYAALEAIIAWEQSEDGPFAWEVLDQAKAALAKARGEQ